MIKPSLVAVEEGAQIVHPVFEHGEPVDAEAAPNALRRSSDTPGSRPSTTGTAFPTSRPIRPPSTG